jgi:hypothetical protein
MFLFVKTEYFRYSFFNLGVKILFLYLDGLLVRYRRYLVPFAIITGLVLIGAFGATNIFRIRNNHVITRLVIQVNGFLITNTRGHLVPMSFDIVS